MEEEADELAVDKLAVDKLTGWAGRLYKLDVVVELVVGEMTGTSGAVEE